MQSPRLSPLWPPVPTTTAFPSLATSAHHHLASPTRKSLRHGNGGLCCTSTPRSSHISRRKLMYIKEKKTSFFLNRKSKKNPIRTGRVN
jgi:hypothetical protein